MPMTALGLAQGTSLLFLFFLLCLFSVITALVNVHPACSNMMTVIFDQCLRRQWSRRDQGRHRSRQKALWPSASRSSEHRFFSLIHISQVKFHILAFCTTNATLYLSIYVIYIAPL